MGGSSLWLIPPKGSHIEQSLSKLIKETLPPLFQEKLVHFQPHMTITSDVSPSLNPQAVVDGVDVTSIPEVRLKELNMGKTYFTRCTFHLERTSSVLDLAIQCRAKYVTNGDYEAARKWAEESFVPHVSLVYAEQYPVPEDVVKGMEEEIKKAGIRVSNDAEGMKGWEGGRIWLVPCSQTPVNDWAPQAEKEIK